MTAVARVQHSGRPHTQTGDLPTLAHGQAQHGTDLVGELTTGIAVDASTHLHPVVTLHLHQQAPGPGLAPNRLPSTSSPLGLALRLDVTKMSVLTGDGNPPAVRNA